MLSIRISKPAQNEHEKLLFSCMRRAVTGLSAKELHSELMDLKLAYCMDQYDVLCFHVPNDNAIVAVYRGNEPVASVLHKCETKTYEQFCVATENSYKLEFNRLNDLRKRRMDAYALQSGIESGEPLFFHLLELYGKGFDCSKHISKVVNDDHAAYVDQEQKVDALAKLVKTINLASV